MQGKNNSLVALNGKSQINFPYLFLTSPAQALSPPSSPVGLALQLPGEQHGNPTGNPVRPAKPPHVPGFHAQPSSRSRSLVPDWILLQARLYSHSHCAVLNSLIKTSLESICLSRQEREHFWGVGLRCFLSSSVFISTSIFPTVNINCFNKKIHAIKF